MTTMAALMRTRAGVVWMLLVGAATFSWALGTDNGYSSGHATASVIIMLVAFLKVRFIGLYFMELRDAPLVLRGLFEGYCLVGCTLVIVVFLLA